MASTPTTAAGAPAEAASSRLFFGYWVVVGAFVAQFVAVGTQNYVAGIFLKPMTQDLDWTRSDYTIARTVSSVVMALIGLFIGGVVDRQGGRLLIFVGSLVMGAALFATGWVQELWQFIALNGIALAIGGAMVGNLVVNVTLSKWFVDRRGRMVGLAAMGVSFAGVVLVPIMTAVVDEWGWRAGWRVMAIAAVACLLPVTLVMRRSPEDYGLNPDGRSTAQLAGGAGQRAAADFANSLTRAQALRTSQFYLMVLAFALFTVSIGVVLVQTIPYLTDAGHSRSTASLMITVTSIPALISKPIWGIFIDRADPRKLTSISAVLTGASLAGIVGAVHADSVWLIGVAFVVLGFGWGGAIPLQETTWASYFGRRYLGSVRSAGLPFSLLLGAGAPQVSSIYYDHVGNYDGAFLAVAVSCLLASGMILAVRKPGIR